MSSNYRSECEDCGWISSPCKSEQVATYAYSRHSCDKQRAAEAARTRRLSREDAIDRTPKMCTHTRVTHTHGTHACYVLDRCRCVPCRDANTAYERDRVRQHAYGRWVGLVDAEPSRRRVQQLRDQGYGLKTIALRVRVSHGALTKLMYGIDGRPPSRRVTPDVERRILAFQPTVDALADGATLEACGAARRLRALVAIGWSQTKLADRVGITLANLNLIALGKQTRVTARVHRAVTNVYDELWNTPPVAADRWAAASITRAKQTAAGHGWPPPLAWDDDTIDEPDATPEGIRTGQPRPIGTGVDADDIIWWLEQEPLATAEQIGGRFGLTRGAVRVALARAGRADQIAQLNRNADLIRSGVGGAA